MKNVINKIQNSKGFVSIESILVIGAVVILAGLILFFFNGKADGVKKGADNQIGTSMTKVQPGTDAAGKATAGGATTLTF